MEIKMQKKALFSNPRNPSFVIVVLVTFKMACDTINIHEEAAIQLMLFDERCQGRLRTTVNCCMYTAAYYTPFAASVNTTKQLILK